MPQKFFFKDAEFSAEVYHQYPNKEQTAPIIVIDNGSHSCRVGWSNEAEPRLLFRNLIAKLRGKKESEAGSQFFGNDITDLEDLKWNVRTQFDMDTVSHMDTQESAFDYMFSHLGINTESINHPVSLTEAVCTPNAFRDHMSELLFECYTVPNIIYSVDSLLSWYHNKSIDIKDGLILRCGYQTSHVLPIVDGQFKPADSRRLNVGGLNMMIFLRRLLQLRHPTQMGNFNLSRAQELLIGHSYIASDYFEELKKWQTAAFTNEKALTIQLPIINTTTEKDLELRKTQARRLKDINQKKREEKIKNEKEQLKKFQEIEELEYTNMTLFKQRLKQEGLQKDTDLHTIIKELEDKILERQEKSRKYLMGLNHCESEEEAVSLDDILKLIANLEDEKLQLTDKRRSRNSRKQALSKRKSYASKERMRILSQLAKGDNPNPKAQKEDTFGMKDEDWDVYKYINKDGSESEDEADQERLNEIEQHLSQHQLTMNRLMVGRGQVYQHLPYDTEQVRVPEILYQPSVVGVEQEGISGMIEYVLKNYSPEKQAQMVQNVLCTGGPTLLPGFQSRLESEVMALLPFQSKFNVTMSKNALLDSWYGARDFVNNNDLSTISISREEYEEQGAGYFKEHFCSNVFVKLDDDE
eukprot:TCONS_00053193-protein